LNRWDNYRLIIVVFELYGKDLEKRPLVQAFSECV